MNAFFSPSRRSAPPPRASATGPSIGRRAQRHAGAGRGLDADRRRQPLRAPGPLRRHARRDRRRSRRHAAARHLRRQRRRPRDHDHEAVNDDPTSLTASSRSRPTAAAARSSRRSSCSRPTNWNIAQTVTVQALDNTIVDGCDALVFPPMTGRVDEIRGPVIIDGGVSANAEPFLHEPADAAGRDEPAARRRHVGSDGTSAERHRRRSPTRTRRTSTAHRRSAPASTRA